MTAISPLSDHVKRVIDQERDVVMARLTALREQAERLRGLQEQLEQGINVNTRVLRRMDELLERPGQLSIEDSDGELRGRRLQQVAIAILRQRKRPGEVVHYRDWYELVLAAGHEVAGRDPLASFLTQVSRSDAVESVKPRSGLYRLRAA